jgi:dTDP-4-dehydrorhamnose reductase
VGSGGRLGGALVRCWHGSHDVVGLARPQIDLTDPASLDAAVAAGPWDAIVTTAALTNVDFCETHRAEAFAVNAEGPARLARRAAETKTRLIHISTDYVFDGRGTRPCLETDEPNPLSVYGESKLAGERAVLEADPDHIVARVSWVFGPERPSFVDMILDRAKTHDHVEAIDDKFASPTFTDDAARWLEALVNDTSLPGGVLHMSNAGSCSWCEFGRQALTCADELGIPLRTTKVHGIPLATMKAFVAARPVFTPLDTSRLAATIKTTIRPWQDAVSDYIRRTAARH